MIFLISKIFLYLLFALALGVAAGWLWRNLQASNRETAVERALAESRSRLPQMETAVRSGEQQLAIVQAELEARELELQGQAERLAARDRTIEELERTCAELRGALEWATAPAPPTEDDQTPAPHAADRAATAGQQPEQLPPDSRDELERLERALAAEKRRVEELTRERELQRRALEALEQQLEMARESRARIANG